MPTPTILILEDSPDRVHRFTTTLRTLYPHAELYCWRSARKMIAEADPLLPRTRLISLDHDLYPLPTDSEDPGDGLEATKYLAAKKLSCPIIIHSSNADRVNMMVGEFELAQLQAKTIAPFGTDWIEVHWANLVRTLIEAGY